MKQTFLERPFKKKKTKNNKPLVTTYTMCTEQQTK